ncbi:hypothetical protein NDU88_004061 [Pleurodeles waltl]|uniref:Uncharacterized protein n=1 Tax=Pleurodeles waltl TaxID=8319 RepID=A0AAV7W5J0_PLEWA|nr:hypothetical protein NDU88_004061 [Pleurodeles waltl]
MDAGRHDSRSPCGLFSLLLAATGTPSAVFRRRDSAPLFPGLIGLGRIASFLPCVPLLRGPRTWFRVAAVVGALILTLAGGGGRPPKSRRQITVPRSKDRGGNSDFPAGLAGGRLQTARQPSGKEASTMKPARNRAGGVEAVRRVQLHPSRISLSAQQTVKYM